LYRQVDDLVQHPVHYNKEEIYKKIDTVDATDLNDYNLLGKDKLVLLPKEVSRRRLILYRMLSVLSMLWTATIIITETTLIAGTQGYQYTLLYYITTKYAGNKLLVFLLSVFFLSGLTLSCLFTIFQIRLSDYYELTPRQTDCVQMSTIMGLSSLIINVVCFNYLFICGEITKDIAD